MWGLAGAGALAFAAYATSTKTGQERIRLAIAQIHEISKPANAKSARSPEEMELRRIAEDVRMLATDRAPLLARIATIEQGMENVTESLALVAAAARAAQLQRESATTLSAVAPPTTTQPTAAHSPATLSAAAPSVTSPTATALSAPTLSAAPPKDRPSAMSVPDVEITSSANAPAGMSRQAPQESPLQPPQIQSPETNAIDVTEYGLDLGGASTIEGVRALWATAQRRYAAHLDGLHPILRLRERTRPTGVELRLVVGPITSAMAAAKLCLAVSAIGATCQPTLFDGQRLALR